eukprot:scaffold416_cov329-Pavlova_lutheri.AAC.23
MVPSDGAPRISPFPSVVRIDAAFVHHRQLPRPPSSRVLGSHPCIHVAFSTVSRGQDDVDLCETGREAWRSIANDVYHVQVPPRTRLVPRTLTSRWSGCRRSKAPPRSCSSFPRMPRHASAASDPSGRPVVARSRAKHGRVSSMPSPTTSSSVSQGVPSPSMEDLDAKGKGAGVPGGDSQPPLAPRAEKKLPRPSRANPCDFGTLTPRCLADVEGS